jgi:hypothetical protein
LTTACWVAETYPETPIPKAITTLIFAQKIAMEKQNPQAFSARGFM